MDSCPEITANNLTIEFLYKNKNNKDIFLEKISKVDLFVYDEQDNYITSQTIDQKSLSDFAGTNLSLQPGTYRIVLWGNAMDRSIFKNISSGSLFKDAFLSNSTAISNSVGSNGDKFYYAPAQTSAGATSQHFTVTIPEYGKKEISVTFGRAHISVIAYIKGLDDQSAQGAQLPPIIELNGISPNYNFEMQTFGTNICYRQVSAFTTVSGEKIAMIEFNTPLFAEDTPMQLLINKQSDGSTVTTVSLEDFIRDNHIIIDESAVDMTISILVEYKQGSIEISFPGWGQIPVNPEL